MVHSCCRAGPVGIQRQASLGAQISLEHVNIYIICTLHTGSVSVQLRLSGFQLTSKQSCE